VRVLAIGAHPDDIELGCGASLAAHRAAGHEVALLVMTTGEQGPQAARSRVEEQHEVAALLGTPVYWGGFEDGEVPDGRAPVAVIEQAMADFGADIVYTHSPRDTHQDHRATGEATLAAARRCSRVLMYESPSSTGFRPTLFVDVADHLETKLSLIRAHISQVLKNGLVDLEAIEALSRHRGFTARVRYAEAFETDRFVLSIGAPQPTERSVDLTLEEIGVAG
jgi:LmbE family N-acetylglucosaminyl deacetylase